MKTLTCVAMLVLLALAAGVTAAGCQAMGGCCGHDNEQAAAPDAKASAYTCPMHPDVKADKPGKCPKCGMNLVPVKESKPATAKLENP